MQTGISDMNRPIWQLTIGEFTELIQQTVQPAKVEISQPNTGKKYVYGIAGIAGIFGCSKTTAGLIKKSGKIDKAISQVGRKITVDVELALELYKLSK
jgi:hypothetical protein